MYYFWELQSPSLIYDNTEITCVSLQRTLPCDTCDSPRDLCLPGFFNFFSQNFAVSSESFSLIWSHSGSFEAKNICIDVAVRK